MRRQFHVLLVCVSLVAPLLGGCGTSGSNPPELPEVHFLVAPLGGGPPTTFRVESLVTGGVTHPSLGGQEFAVTGNMDFVVEGSNPPYSATFVRTGTDGEIRVTLLIVTAAHVNNDVVAQDETSAVNDHIVTVQSGTPLVTTPIAPALEVRFNVCAPRPDVTSCFTTVADGHCSITTTMSCTVATQAADCPGETCVLSIDPGNPDSPFSGSIGDGLTTHLVGAVVPDLFPLAPTVYFLEGAQDSVNGVFRAQPKGPFLAAQLLLNGQVKVSDVTTGDIVLREDL